MRRRRHSPVSSSPFQFRKTDQRGGCFGDFVRGIHFIGPSSDINPAAGRSVPGVTGDPSSSEFRWTSSESGQHHPIIGRLIKPPITSLANSSPICSPKMGISAPKKSPKNGNHRIAGSLYSKRFMNPTVAGSLENKGRPL